MKQASIRELFDHWNQRRGNRAAPERGDIEPAAIRRALADTFILAFDSQAGHPFRIGGTRVCAAFGRELKGESFVGLWAPESRTAILDLVKAIAAESIGAVASATVHNSEGDPLALEVLLLPLSHRGQRGARILGALVPTETPYWLGIATLGPLELGTHRYLGAQLTAPVQSRIGARVGGDIRRGWVVYEGGRTDR